MKNMLAKIREDMTVYDNEGNKVGKVEVVQFGDEDLEQPGAETQTAQKPKISDNDLTEDVRRAVSFDEQIPDEIRQRLHRYGYVKVDPGLLQSDRYIIADQIAEVTDDQVKLKIGKDDLLKI